MGRGKTFVLDSFEKELNDILVDTFRSILKVEEDTLKRTLIDLSISELHLLEAVGKNGSRAEPSANLHRNWILRCLLLLSLSISC
jgi:hypothetical protein